MIYLLKLFFIWQSQVIWQKVGKRLFYKLALFKIQFIIIKLLTVINDEVQFMTRSSTKKYTKCNGHYRCSSSVMTRNFTTKYIKGNLLSISEILLRQIFDRAKSSDNKSANAIVYTPQSLLFFCCGINSFLLKLISHSSAVSSSERGSFFLSKINLEEEVLLFTRL